MGNRQSVVSVPEWLTAVAHGDIRTVDALLAKDPAIMRAQSDEGETAVHVAARTNLDMLRLLLEKGGNMILDQQDRHGRTPLLAACTAATVVSEEAALQILASHPAVSHFDRQDRGLLHYAVDNGLEKVLGLAVTRLKSPVELNRRDADGATPLHLALTTTRDQHGDEVALRIVKTLLSHGADPTIPDAKEVLPNISWREAREIMLERQSAPPPSPSSAPSDHDSDATTSSLDEEGQPADMMMVTGINYNDDTLVTTAVPFEGPADRKRKDTDGLGERKGGEKRERTDEPLTYQQGEEEQGSLPEGAMVSAGHEVDGSGKVVEQEGDAGSREEQAKLGKGEVSSSDMMEEDSSTAQREQRLADKEKELKEAEERLRKKEEEVKKWEAEVAHEFQVKAEALEKERKKHEEEVWKTKEMQDRLEKEKEEWEASRKGAEREEAQHLAITKDEAVSMDVQHEDGRAPAGAVKTASLLTPQQPPQTMDQASTFPAPSPAAVPSPGKKRASRKVGTADHHPSSPAVPLPAQQPPPVDMFETPLVPPSDDAVKAIASPSGPLPGASSSPVLTSASSSTETGRTFHFSKSPAQSPARPPAAATPRKSPGGRKASTTTKTSDQEEHEASTSSSSSSARQSGTKPTPLPSGLSASAATATHAPPSRAAKPVSKAPPPSSSAAGTDGTGSSKSPSRTNTMSSAKKPAGNVIDLTSDDEED